VLVEDDPRTQKLFVEKMPPIQKSETTGVPISKS
jgi:hypothetical protein